MKKIYLLSFSALLAGSVSAQTVTTNETVKQEIQTVFNPTATHYQQLSEDRAANDIIWSDDFSTPANWTAGGPSSDYTLNGWSVAAATGGWFFPASGNMGTTGNFARFVNGDPNAVPSTVVENGPFTLTYTGTIPDLSAVPAPHLEFEQYGARFITLQGVQVSTDGGTTWIEVMNNNDITPNTSTTSHIYGKPETRRFNMTNAIAGNPANVSIRLFWDGAINGPAMNYIEYGWFVDNIRIVEGYAYDNELQSNYMRAGVGLSYPTGLDYYRIPTSQLSPLDFSVITTNQGGSLHTGLQLTATVDKSGNVFTGTSTPIDLAASATDSIGTSTQFTPASGTGTYNVAWHVAGTNPEGITTNDDATSSFMVTDYTYARDNNTLTGSIGNVTSNTGSPLLIGNTMEIFADGVIGALDIKISNTSTNSGQLIYGQISRYNDGTSAWEPVDITADRTLTNSDLNQFVRVTFATPVQVFAGDLILVMAGHYGNTPEVSFGYAQEVDEQTVLGYTSGASDPFSLITPNAIMVRADMRDFTGIEEVSGNVFTIGQNVPNPFSNTSLITYTLSEAANVNIEFVDVTGKVVKTITPGSQAAGTYSITIDGSDLAAGTYFYTFTCGAEKVTKQMVVTK